MDNPSPCCIELSLSVTHEPSWLPLEAVISQWLQAAICQKTATIKQAAGHQSLAVGLSVVDEVTIQALNHQYRDKNKATNVLSFPNEAPIELAGNDLGDIIVCGAVLEREAKALHRSLEAHWAHLLVHGMLHLQGYDHVIESDAEVMEALEVHILSQLGFENPYVSKDSTNTGAPLNES